MQIKKFKAVDMAEALKLVKTELGSDAVILSSKNIQKGGGAFGLFGRSLVEVTAANNYEAAVKLNTEEKQTDDTSTESNVKSVIDNSFSSMKNKKVIDKDNMVLIKNDLSDIKSEMHLFKKSYDEKQKQVFVQVKNEINELKTIIGNMVSKGDNLSKNPRFQLPENLELLKNKIMDQGVSKFVSERLINYMDQKIKKEEIGKKEYLDSYLHNLILRHVKVSGEISNGNKNRKIAMFVGATGVGKTTTIAKLAAEYSLNKKMKVGLITLDTYRIAAVEQLRIYANILKIPVFVAVSPMELESVLEETKDFDMILIDTAGRSYNNDEQIGELKEYYSQNFKIDTHLVLNANSKESDLSNIINRFKTVPIKNILFTKLDETLTYGSILNVMIQSSKPLSYITTGQCVPEDIELASAMKVVDLVMGKDS